MGIAEGLSEEKSRTFEEDEGSSSGYSRENQGRSSREFKIVEPQH